MLAHCLWWKPKIYIRTQSKCKKRLKQSFSIKQFLETLFSDINMYTGFTTYGIYVNTGCAVSLASHLRADAFRLISSSSAMRGQSHKSEWWLLKGWNLPATALRWLASDTEHIAFIHMLSVAKPVHIFMAKNRVSKSCLKAELFPSFCAFWLCFKILNFSLSHYIPVWAKNHMVFPGFYPSNFPYFLQPFSPEDSVPLICA